MSGATREFYAVPFMGGHTTLMVDLQASPLVRLFAILTGLSEGLSQ